MTAGKDIEIRGQNVEEAVQAGLAKLGLNRNDVIIDVIDEGSKGILGIGSREAVVRLVSMVSTTPPPPPPAPKPKPEAKKVERQPATAVAPKPAKSQTPDASKPVRPQSPPPTAEEVQEEREVALEIMETILKQMQIAASIDVVVSEPDDITGRQVNELQITGSDLGVLIGPRGDTLNSLQYITRLMAGHRLHRRTDFVIDIEGYRERRRQALARLANRMADKVISRKRPVTLEPMPAYERRIIHMTLRDNDEVTTQSTGEGNRRRVRILSK